MEESISNQQSTLKLDIQVNEMITYFFPSSNFMIVSKKFIEK